MEIPGGLFFIFSDSAVFRFGGAAREMQEEEDGDTDNETAGI